MLLEFCSTFKNTLLLWLLLWTSKVTNNSYNDSFVPEYLTYFNLHIFVYIITSLRMKATPEHGLVWEYSESSAPRSLVEYHPSDALSLRLMEKSPHKTKATTISVHWCSFGIQGEGAVSAELPLCPKGQSFERKVWITDVATDAGHAVVSLQVRRGIHAHSVLFSTMLQVGLHKIYEQLCSPLCSMPKNQKKKSKFWKNRQHFARLAVLCEFSQPVKTRTVHPALNPSTSTSSHLPSPCG